MSSMGNTKFERQELKSHNLYWVLDLLVGVLVLKDRHTSILTPQGIPKTQFDPESFNVLGYCDEFQQSATRCEPCRRTGSAELSLGKPQIFPAQLKAPIMHRERNRGLFLKEVVTLCRSQIPRHHNYVVCI